MCTTVVSSGEIQTLIAAAKGSTMLYQVVLARSILYEINGSVGGSGRRLALPARPGCMNLRDIHPSLAQFITLKIPLHSYLFESSPSKLLHNIPLSHFTK